MSDYTYYEILDISPDATTKEIKAAYQRAVRVAHPDVGGNAAMFGLVRKAYETLSNPLSRSAYDAGLREPEEPPVAAADEPSPTPPEPEWGEEVDWRADQRRRPRREPEWGQEVDGSVDDGPGPRVATPDYDSPYQRRGPATRFEVWAASKAGLKGLIATIVLAIGLYSLFAVILFGNPDLIRPEAATPDLVEWAIVDGPFLRIVVILYTVALLTAFFGAAPYVLAGHGLAVIGLLIWILAYWDIATMGERWAFSGLAVLWLIYTGLLVLVPVMLGMRTPDEDVP